MQQDTIITILGSSGGVAKAVLSLLNHSAQDPNSPLHPVISNAHLHLIDRKQKGDRYYRKLLPALASRYTLHQFGLRNLPRFREHLKQTRTTLVIDVSWADTAEILRCCNGLGVRYVNTALENAMIDEYEDRFKGFGMAERVKALAACRDDFTNTTAIIGSGMNPGVVQWMALALMKQNPGRPLLGCYVVEHDTSFYADQTRVKADTLYTTWAPECFVDEAILNYPMFMSHSMPVYLYDQVYALEFHVRLGSREFDGCLMPHEEVFSLGGHYGFECGFLYRVSEHTTRLIQNNLDQVDSLWDWEMSLLDPTLSPLDGSDLVGVLLVYDDQEHYMYNEMHNQDVYARYGVNATYFQVACGVYGAVASILLDPLPAGIYYVDELLRETQSAYGRYLSYYMTDFVVGKNGHSDGLLLQRLTRVDL
jgi:hypothetical protein